MKDGESREILHVGDEVTHVQGSEPMTVGVLFTTREKVRVAECHWRDGNITFRQCFPASDLKRKE